MTRNARHVDGTLATEIESFIADESQGSFEPLMLRLFKRQYELNEPYRIFCDSLGQTPSNVHSWKDIPAVPAKAFKLATLTCAPPEQALRIFHSSGTTEGEPSKHYLDAGAVNLYKTSLRSGFYRVIPTELPIVALMPPLAEAPHSSLSFMLDALNAERFVWGDTGAFNDLLDRSQNAGQPICLFGTAFALLELFDESSSSWQLPSGSYVVETGGFKGRMRQVSKAELYVMIRQRLGVSPPNAIAEYGMSEMASQFYGTPDTGLTSGHWLRARIIDPITEHDAEEGLLCHYDLANWNSVAAIQTQDMARRCEKGGFELLGRSPHAELRGCSLTVEERWTTMR